MHRGWAPPWPLPRGAGLTAQHDWDWGPQLHVPDIAMPPPTSLGSATPTSLDSATPTSLGSSSPICQATARQCRGRVPETMAQQARGVVPGQG